MASDQEFQNCPNCFIYWSVPKAMFDAKRADGTQFYCPNGHTLSYHDSEHERVRRERDRLKQDAARVAQEKARLEKRVEAVMEQRDHAQRQVSAAKGRITRLKNRAAAGLCPCCNRSFENLQRHMASKHAGFLAEEVQAEAGQVKH